MGGWGSKGGGGGREGGGGERIEKCGRSGYKYLFLSPLDATLLSSCLSGREGRERERKEETGWG